MKKKKQNLKPNGLAYFTYTQLSKLYCFFRGWKVDRSVLKEELKKQKQDKKGFMVLYNHSGRRDHLMLASAMNGHKTNIVLAKYFYFEHFIATVTSWVKTIYKDQFKPDLQSIRNMKRAIDRPGVVAISPTGQVSEDGGDCFVSHSIVKLVRFCKSDVLGFVTYGMHYCFPKWGKNKRRTKVCGEFVKIVSKEELDTLTDDEIYERIRKVAAVNLQDYQEEHLNVIKGKGLAEGLENTLYRCPKCGHVHSNYTKDNKIICKDCGNEFIYNKYGFLDKASEDSVGFRREDEWTKYQMDEIKKEIKENDDFFIEGEFDLHRNLKVDNVLEYVGSGIVHLSKTELYYEGTENGEKIHKDFAIESIFQLPHSTGKSFFIPDDEGTYKFFATKQKSKIFEFVQVVDALRELEEEEGKVF